MPICPLNTKQALKSGVGESEERRGTIENFTSSVIPHCGKRLLWSRLEARHVTAGASYVASYMKSPVLV